MKKIGLLICVLAMALTLCEGPMGPPGRDGEALNWKIVYYTVKAGDWKLLGKKDALGSHFMYEFKEDALTKTIYKDGKIITFRVSCISFIIAIQTICRNNKRHLSRAVRQTLAAFFPTR